MTNSEYVNTRREKQRKKFGTVGLKTDCENYSRETGVSFCKVCQYDKHMGCLPCVLGVCYFYSNNEEEKQ